VASKDNKNYLKVRTELSKMYKPSQYQTLYNNLVTVANNTEDKELIRFIQSYCDSISEIPSLAIRKLPQSLQKAMNNSLSARTDLDNYCAEIITCYKPEWQIIAERKGWGPIN
jgi:hypothetical protein